MLCCTSSNTLTRGKYQGVPKISIIQKMHRLWNGVEHLVTYPNVLLFQS